MPRVSLMVVLCLVAPVTLAAQQPPVPHDSVRGAIRAVDMRARALEVTTGVGFALRVVRINVPAGVPITDRQDAQPKLIGLAALKPGDVVRAVFGGRPSGFVAYTIERVGRMEAGVESTP
jgi:hypothetical protein